MQMNTNSIEFYDNHFKKDKKRWGGIQSIDNLVNLALQWYIIFSKNKNPRIIDLGCGQGRTIKAIDDINYSIIGVDFSKEALKIAKKENKKYINFVECDMRNTPFVNSSFDVVLSIGSHEHLNEIDFKEPYRLLKEDGVFICVFPFSETDKGWVKGYQEEWILSRNTWNNLLKDFGFVQIDHLLNKEGFFLCKKII